MQKTRQRILDYLDQRGGTSARQLAQAFGMSPANLRRHLSILQDRDLVTAVGYRRARGQGRPEQVYAPKSSHGENLEPLARALLHYVSADDQKMKQLVKDMLGSTKTASGQITQRLVAAVRHLEPHGYRPRWEARPQGPQMVFGRCPYAVIIADHPELCRMDAHMLEELLAAPVEQTAKLQPGPQHVPQCVFILAREIKVS